jgi:uncharacterized membrane protein YphA (DoxX/SURF4 family)
MRVDAALVVQFAVGCVFLFSATSKLEDPSDFARGVLDYQIVKAPLGYFVAFCIIVVESLLAVCHLMNWFVRIASVVGLFLLVSFFFAVWTNLRRGRTLPCFCFGASQNDSISKATILRLLLMFTGELIVFLSKTTFYRYSIGSSGWAIRGIEFMTTLSSALLLLVFVMWISALQDFVAFLRRRPRTRDV